MSFVLRVAKAFLPKADQAKKIDKPDIEIGITSVDFVTVSADATKGKAPSSTLGLIIKGGTAYSLDTGDFVGVESNMKKLGEWASLYAADPTTYRAVQVDINSAGQTVRRYTLPQAFIAAYNEGVDEESGGGYFELTVYQKGDLKANVAINSGFTIEESK